MERMKTTPAVAEQRIAVCKQCSELTTLNRCKQCGCFMTLKVHIAAAQCPLGKW